MNGAKEKKQSHQHVLKPESAPGLKYKADFIVFNTDNSYDVIDVKGIRTKEYITKKKVFEDKYNMKITEI